MWGWGGGMVRFEKEVALVRLDQLQGQVGGEGGKVTEARPQG